MADYRWNVSDFAIAYDESADQIHPRYLEMQDTILQLLPLAGEGRAVVVDAGGGSGRLIERTLDRWPQAIGIVVDQSEAFLALAERRLARFGDRAVCLQSRLQDDWLGQLPSSPSAIVSMSAIHHLDAVEKQTLYRRCAAALPVGGVLLNGDEVRPADDAEYLRLLTEWTDGMRQGIAEGRITPLFTDALDRFTDRNVTRFGQPKASGDDCHQTADEQLAYLRAAGFSAVDLPWRQEMWALLRGVR
jgi:SAM-dependent methyltransferase